MTNSIDLSNVRLDHKIVDTARWAKRFRHASKVIAFLVAALGLVVLGGWAFNVPALTYIRPTLQSMKVNTAFSFLCLGAGLWLGQNDKWQRSRRILGLLVVVIAGLTLAEYAFHVNLGFDQLLFRDRRIPSLSAYPGRMAITTATCLLLLGLAVTFSGLKKAVALRHTLVAPCFALSVVALCGYLYGAKSLYSVTSFSTVGVHTAAGLFAACLAYFLARPDEGIVSLAASDTNSGLLLRTLFPAIIVVPILIGWLRLEGERATLYDTQFGVALLVLGSIGCLTALTVMVARSMRRFESERFRAEAARIRSAAIVESSDDAIIGTNVSGTVTDWNKGAERLFGYLASEAIGKSISFLAPTGQLDQSQHIFKKVISGNLVKNHETVRQRKDGTHVEISLTASPIVDVEGRVVGVSGIARDITERKLAEDTLRHSEERFRLAAQAGRMYAYEWDVTTDVIVRSGYDLLGSASEASLTRQQLQARVHPDDRAIFNASVSEHTPEHPDVQISYRMLRPDGSAAWVEKTAHAMFDEQGKMVRVVGMVADITERKSAEETLRESEEKFRSVFRDAGVGMVIVSPLGHFLAANRTFCDYLGYTEDELLGRTVESITFPEDWPAFAQRLREALTQERGFQWFQKRCLHKSGRIVYTETSASVIQSRDGDPQYFVGQVLDITKRKEAEEALSGMTRKLLEAQEQERARIARELHDDINQRLAMLSVNIEQLEENPSEIGNRLQEVGRQVSDISSDVQALSHDLHSSQLEYLGAVAGIRSWCKEFAERQKMEVDFGSEVSSPLPVEIGLCLFRVLQEALHNAVKHSRVKKVEVRLTEQANEVRLIVSDLGTGFDVDAAKQGRGLGLTSMRERVRLLQGTISIESKPMAGTTIHVRVPLGSEGALPKSGGVVNRIIAGTVPTTSTNTRN